MSTKHEKRTQAKARDHEIARRIAQRIRSRRKERRMSLGRLAEAMGITYQQFQKYECRINSVPSSRLPELA